MKLSLSNAGRICLVLGGTRSGKSSYAESLAIESGLPVTYIATYAAQVDDVEMAARIDTHLRRRPAHWRTVENRFDLAELFSEAPGSLCLLDCLTLWLSFQQMQLAAELDILRLLEAALLKARDSGSHLLIVSNELGSGLVPSSREGRSFRDLCGRANQLVARYADAVELVVAGLPLRLKGAH